LKLIEIKIAISCVDWSILKQASLDAWENSEVALSLIEEVNKYSTRQRVTGLETWFYLPNLTLGAPPKWKMAIVSFIAAYSISLVAHYILSIYLEQLTHFLVLLPAKYMLNSPLNSPD
jgi:antibiotic biosynthesis monooxygenase (ABM) superfamily enzyme